MTSRYVIYEAMRAMRRYGILAARRDERDMWIPIKKCVDENNFNSKSGKWSAEHVSPKALKISDPRSDLHRRSKKGDKIAYYLFQMYSIPAERKCNIENALRVSYNIGLYDERLGRISYTYKENFYTSLYDDYDLGNMNKYIKPGDLKMTNRQFVELMGTIHDSTA